MTDQEKLAAPDKAPTLGGLARDLRFKAGLTRRVFGEQTQLGELVIKRFETGRLKLTTEQLQRVLRHPAMKDLPLLASSKGL